MKSDNYWTKFVPKLFQDRELNVFLASCTPFKAKAHLKEIDAMFVRFNQYVAKKQQVRISLKVPVK